MSRIPESIIKAAQASETKWGIPSSISLAQWALESGWGKKDMGVFNYFGMKARKARKALGKQGYRDPFIMRRTREVINGKEVFMDQPFRKFPSAEASFDAHGELLATAKVYAKCRAKLPDVDAFADSLTGVYATDPLYGKLLRQIMGGSQKLYQYNLHPSFKKA